MPSTNDQLRNDCLSTQLGEPTRFFYEGPDLEFRRSRVHARRLPGLAIRSEDAAWKRDDWKLEFSYQGYVFLIEAYGNPGLSVFIVDDPECPEEILARIADWFEQVGPHAPPTRGDRIRLFLLLALVLICPIVIVFWLLSGEEHN